MTNEKNTYFTEKIKIGHKTYFFDVKESIKEELYIVINETSENAETLKHSRIFVFKEAVIPFMEGLTKAVDYLKSHSKK